MHILFNFYDFATESGNDEVAGCRKQQLECPVVEIVCQHLSGVEL